MKIIDKTTLIISDLAESISEIVGKVYVLAPDITELPCEAKYVKKLVTDGTFEVSGIGNKKYNLPYCTAITEMIAEEKTVVDDVEAYAQRQKEFYDKRIRVNGNADLLTANTKLKDLFVRIQGQPSVVKAPEQQVVQHPNGKVENIVTFFNFYMNMLIYEDYLDLKNVNGVTITTLDNDSIEVLDSDGYFKYLVPQVTE